jgi:hypothetical protein
LKSPVIRFVPQRPIESRRRNLERVRLRQRRVELIFLDIEQRAQILADTLAISNADSVLVWVTRFSGVRAIDDDAKYRADRFAA